MSYMMISPNKVASFCYFEYSEALVIAASPAMAKECKCTALHLRLGDHDDGNRYVEKSTIDNEEPEKDTIRVRIWRALASGDELSMTQLCKQVGERNRGDLRSHLTHVERQAKTIRNKSDEWRIRRGLLPVGVTNVGDGSSVGGAKKLRLKMRRGAKNEVFIRLV